MHQINPSLFCAMTKRNAFKVEEPGQHTSGRFVFECCICELSIGAGLLSARAFYIPKPDGTREYKYSCEMCVRAYTVALSEVGIPLDEVWAHL